MKNSDYLLIDKSFLNEGAKLSFKLYRMDKEHSSFYPVLFRNNAITPLEWKQWRKVDLYIQKKDEETYEQYAVTHMSPSSVKTFNTFIARSKQVLQKAEASMYEVFSDPAKAKNLPKIKAIIDDFILTVNNDEFTVMTLNKLTTHDYDTPTHSINVAMYALSFGKYLKLSHIALHQLGIAALIHDMGKSKLRSDVINRNGRLCSYEIEYIRQYPKLSYDIAKEMGIKNEKILHAIRQHRENIDGSGYPDQLQAGQISLYARILSICDAFDALTTTRSYKNSVSSFETLKIMKKEMENQLDKKLLNKFIMMMHT